MEYKIIKKPLAKSEFLHNINIPVLCKLESGETIIGKIDSIDEGNWPYKITDLNNNNMFYKKSEDLHIILGQSQEGEFIFNPIFWEKFLKFNLINSKINLIKGVRYLEIPNEGDFFNGIKLIQIENILKTKLPKKEKLEKIKTLL